MFSKSSLTYVFRIRVFSAFQSKISERIRTPRKLSRLIIRILDSFPKEAVRLNSSLLNFRILDRISCWILCEILLSNLFSRIRPNRWQNADCQDRQLWLLIIVKIIDLIIFCRSACPFKESIEAIGQLDGKGRLRGGFGIRKLNFRFHRDCNSSSPIISEVLTRTFQLGSSSFDHT